MADAVPAVVDTRRGRWFRLQSVPVSAVELAPGFWHDRLQRNRTAGLPHFHRLMEEHGVLDNFRRLSGRKDVAYRFAGYVSESDLYKWVEGACWALAGEDDPDLRRLVDLTIEEIEAAQQPDGYLYIQSEPGTEGAYERFSKLQGSHELYCLGHLMQAAVAHFRVTGSERLLAVARRAADYLLTVFGPGKLERTDGHPEIEMALVELYRATGERAYLDLAGFFLSLPQSHADLPPIASRPALVGHAVRSGYICCAGADWHAETGDSAMWANLLRLWEDLVSAKLYVTGGVGARHEQEAFGAPYELPHARAYAETCAQIAHAMWAWRMLLCTGEARFADVLELILYNGFLSGVSLSGTEYFYANPLACDGGYARVPWFGCNCCPPNVGRTLAAVPGYLFSTDARGLWVHLYDACQATLPGPDGRPVRLRLKTRYPWEGAVELSVTPPEPAEFSLFLRLPGWADSATLAVNGTPLPAHAGPGGYLEIRREWRPGDHVHLEFPLPVRVLQSHPWVSENRGAVALQRGPLVYCVESVDHPGVDLRDLTLDLSAEIAAEARPDLLDGLVVLRGTACAPEASAAGRPLYCPRGSAPSAQRPVPLTAIPYYAWANRGDSALRVWLPTA